MGGAILGLIAGGLVHFMMRRIDEYVVEIMLTLALVTVTYTVAAKLHVSGLIAVVVAGAQLGLYRPDVLAKADLANGKAKYQQLCLACHQLHGEGGTVGPELTGANRAETAPMIPALPKGMTIPASR